MLADGAAHGIKTARADAAPTINCVPINGIRLGSGDEQGNKQNKCGHASSQKGSGFHVVSFNYEFISSCKTMVSSIGRCCWAKCSKSRLLLNTTVFRSI